MTRFSMLILVLFFHHNKLDAQVCFNDNPMVYSAPVGVTFITNVSAGNFNGDNFPDAVFAWTNSIILKMGSANGSFTIGQQFLINNGVAQVIGKDMDNDGFDDIVAVDGNCNLHVFFHDGNGNFADSLYSQSTGLAAAKVMIDDVNTDGFDDVIIYNYAASSLSIHLSNGNRAYLPGTINLTFVPEALALGRFNSDNFPDLVFSDGSDFIVYNGDATGGFISGNAFTLAPNVDHLAIADMNNDGNTDIIYSKAQGVYIAFCNAGGTISTTFSIELLDIPYRYLYADDIFTYDFNNDNYPEIVMPSLWNYNVAVVNNSAGSFSLKQYATAGGSGSACIADFDVDGFMDIMSTSRGAVGYFSVLKGSGSGNFKGTTYLTASFHGVFQGSTIAAGDLNNDGFSDLATNGFDSLSVILNDGTGHFSLISNTYTGSGSVPWGSPLAIADFNNDGNNDIVLSDYSQQLKLMLGNGNGIFMAPVVIYPSGLNYPDVVVTGNFNNDTIPDLALSSQTGVIVLINNGNGVFNYISTVGGPGAVYGITVNDFNEDGTDDLAFVKSQVGGAMYVNDGTGNFTFGTGYISCGAGDLSSIASGDLNHDGHADIAFTDNDCVFPHRVIVYYGDGAGQLISGGTLNVFETPYQIAIEDINFDGYDDIITNGSNGIITVLLNSATGFSSTFYLASGSISQTVLVNDFNNDNKPDLAYNNTYSRDIGVSLNSIARIYPGTQLTVCNGDSLLLYITDTVPGFQWNTGATNDSIYVTNAGTYSVNAGTSSFGTCFASSYVFVSMSNPATVIFNSSNNPVSTCINQTVILQANPPGGVFSGPGVSGNIFDPSGLTGGANYTISYNFTDSNGCASSTTTHIIFVDNCAGILDLESENIKLSPNPVREQVQIEQPTFLPYDRGLVYDSYGNLVIEFMMTKELSFLNTSMFNPGIYHLKLFNKQSEKQSVILKIAVVK